MTINLKYKVLFMLHFLLHQVRCGTLLFDLKLVTNAPDGAESPGWMILDLFPQPLNMDVDGPGVSDVFISPDLVEELFPCEHLIRGRSQEIKQLQFLGRHIYGMPVADNGIVGQIDREAVVFNAFCLIFRGLLGFDWLIPAQDCADPCDHFLGIKGLHNIVVGAELKSEYFIKNFSFCGKHDDRRRGFGADLTAHLVPVDSRKHQIKENQVGMIGFIGGERILSIIYNLCIKSFLYEIKGNKFCDIFVVIDN